MSRSHAMSRARYYDSSPIPPVGDIPVNNFQGDVTPDDVRFCPLDVTRGGKRVTCERPGAPTWCREHEASLAEALRSLVDLAVKCRTLEDGRMLGQPEKVDIRVTTIVPPSQSPAYDAVNAVAAWASESAYGLAKHLGDADPSWYTGRGVPVQLLWPAVTYLSRRFTPALSADVDGRWGSKLFEHEARLRAQAGQDRLVHWLPMPCIQCGRKALRRKDGQEKVECSGCRRTWPWEHYEFLAASYARGIESQPEMEIRHG